MLDNNINNLVIKDASNTKAASMKRSQNQKDKHHLVQGSMWRLLNRWNYQICQNQANRPFIETILTSKPWLKHNSDWKSAITRHSNLTIHSGILNAIQVSPTANFDYTSSCKMLIPKTFRQTWHKIHWWKASKELQGSMRRS